MGWDQEGWDQDIQNIETEIGKRPFLRGVALQDLTPISLL